MATQPLLSPDSDTKSNYNTDASSMSAWARQSGGSVAAGHPHEAWVVSESTYELDSTQGIEHSKLWNADLAPTTKAQRTWNTYHIASLWISMVVVITTYTLGGSFIAQGMTWWQAMLTILLGNTIVLIPLMLNAHAGTRYGVSFPVLCRSSFGISGAHVPAIARTIVLAGWFGIQTWIGGEALDVLVTTIWSGWSSVTGHEFIMFGLFWAIQVVIILRGVESIRVLESVAAPLLLIASALLLGWAVHAGGGFTRVLSSVELLREQPSNASFWTLFPSSLAAACSYWATLALGISDFTRYAESQRAQMVGQAIGLPLTMAAFSFIGVATTAATVLIYGHAIPDPVQLVGTFNNIFIVLFATIVVFVAQLSTNMAANVLSPSNDISHLRPQSISLATGGVITAVIGVCMAPWYLVRNASAYIFTWLIGYSGLMGVIAGVMICDYWLVRKQVLDVRALFTEGSEYEYTKGYNWRAFIATGLPMLPIFPGFIRAVISGGERPAHPDFWDWMYVYSWFFTILSSAAIYYTLMKLPYTRPPSPTIGCAIDRVPPSKEQYDTLT